ncbi:MAG: stage 0 sporulation protein [Syntrophomonadaceae bacterium]|nr:stage 0 sporulation protein [Syntrophomonadaceae bacterium]
MSEEHIIGVQFEPVGKIYYFNASEHPDVSIDSHVIVNTVRGLQLAKVAQTAINTEGIKEEIKPIERPATPRDLMLRQMISEKESEALNIVREHVKKSTLEGMKVVSTEYSFDATRITIYINYESESKLDIKSFHKEISQKFPDLRVEIRQIGPRDVAKALGGMGACGLERRCCSTFISEFNSISIRMAKTQDISLTPTEITGMCGRLRCCLIYEYDLYEEARKTLPKRKKLIQTPMGEGRVIQVLPLSQSVVVDIPERGPHQFTKEELDTGKIIIPEPPQKKKEYFQEMDVEIVSTKQVVSTPSEKTSPDKKNYTKSTRQKQSRRSRRRRK